MNPIDLIGGFYTVDGLSWACQDTVNYLPTKAEAAGTKTPAMLKTPPGLKPYVNIGDAPSFAIRGMHDVEGALFVVSGRKLYQISNKGIAIPIGTIPGVSRVSMAHNQITGGNELLVVNGTAGYVYNTVTQVFERVTDEGYPGSFLADYIDSYLMQVEPFGRFLFHSNLADATDYNTLDRFEAETYPDKVVSMLVDHQEVWAFGERSIDLFENSGSATGTFIAKGISIEQGCAGRFTPAKLDNSVFWLGNDGIVYRANGYNPIRISTHAIEDAIADCDWSQAFAFTWSSKGHKVYYLTFPDGQTWGFDVSSGLWHRRATYTPAFEVSRRWRLNDLVYSNGKWIGGDSLSGKLYILDWDYMLDDQGELVSERVSPIVYNAGSRFTVDAVELLMRTGDKPTEAFAFPIQPEGPTITGDAPDGYTGQEYSYQYTTVAGDAPISKVIAFDLPEGWAMSNTGLLTGSSDVPTTLNFRVRVVDTNGLWDEVDDTIEIGAAWWLTGYDAPGQFNSVYISPTPKNMTGALVTTRNPAINLSLGAFGGGYYQYPGILVGLSSAGLLERADHIRESDGVVITETSTVGSMGASDGIAVVAYGDVVVVTRRNGTNYFTSTNKGSTFTSRTAPGGLRMPTVGRLGNGRWIAACHLGATTALYYSDEAVPVNWVVAPLTGAPLDVMETTRIVVSGNKAIFVAGTAYAVTNGGAAWVSQTHGFTTFASTCGASDGNSFVFGGVNESSLLRTTDAGTNWAKTAFTGVTRISVYGGLWVMTAPGETGGIFWSENNCATLTASVLPVGVDPSFYGQLFLSPVSNIPVEP